MTWWDDLMGTGTTAVDPATNQKGFWNADSLGPILGVGTSLLGQYLGGKATEGDSDKDFERKKELMRLQYELAAQNQAGGSGAANELARKQLAMTGLKNWIDSNNQSQALLSNATQGVGTAAARAYYRTRGG